MHGQTCYRKTPTMQNRLWNSKKFAWGLWIAFLPSCTRDVETSPPPDPTQVVQAQFDPTNSIPVLRIVPSPTGIAQLPSGALNPDFVTPAPCQLPNPVECLSLAQGGWPSSTPITFYFSGELEESTISRGIRLFRLTKFGPAPVAFDFVMSPRPPPPEACQTSGNGSNPPETFSPEDVPPGVQVVLRPREAVRKSTRYIAVVEGGENGLRGAGNLPVEPSSLFFLLNTPRESPPVDESGVILSGLLRAEVVATTLESQFGGRTLEQLSVEEQALFAQALEATGLQLRQLYDFFSLTIDPLIKLGVIANRQSLAFVNTWTTENPPGLFDFDPLNKVLPFPNVQLLTQTSSAAVGGLLVALPVDPSDTSPAASLIRNINTLNGFSTTAPIQVPLTRPVDLGSLQDRLLMYPVDGRNRISGPRVMLSASLLSSTSTTSTLTVSLALRPSRPLDQNQNYVIAVQRGVVDDRARDMSPAPIFDLLKLPDPFIDASTGQVLPQVEPLLRCSTVPTLGRLATDREVLGLATALERDLQHSRWYDAFEALEAASVPIPRSDLLTAFNYKTQSVTDTVDLIKNTLLPGPWRGLSPSTPTLTGPILSLSGSDQIISGFRLATGLCAPLCERGALGPIAPTDCRDSSGEATSVVASHPVCLQALDQYTGQLDSAQLYSLRRYRITAGNPFVAGAFSQATVRTPAVEQIPMWVIRSNATPPVDGVPIAIFQHGLGQRKEDALLVANTLAQVPSLPGWATVAIDFPFHGTQTSDLVVNATGVPCLEAFGAPSDIDPAGVVCDATGVCTGGCDGIQDESGTGFLAPPNVFSLRDNFRQGLVDMLTLVRALQQEASPSGVLSNLNGDRLGVLGQSLGGIAVGNLAAYLRPDEVNAIAINVGGGSFVPLLAGLPADRLDAVNTALAVAGICQPIDPRNLAKGCKDTADYRLFQLFLQWVGDPGDPVANSIGVSSELFPGRTPLGTDRLLIQMAVPDLVVSNRSSEILGSAYGFATDGSDAQFQRYDFSGVPNIPAGSGCHGFLLYPVCGACTCDALCATFGSQLQAAGFLASGSASIGPQRPPSLPGIDCNDPCSSCPF
jgi:hypothetical protein